MASARQIAPAYTGQHTRRRTHRLTSISQLGFEATIHYGR